MTLLVCLSVPCKTWDADYALGCFGPEYESKSVEGIVMKVRTTRNGKIPRFEVNFPEKRCVKTYVNFDLDYILKYAEEVPLRYILK